MNEEEALINEVLKKGYYTYVLKEVVKNPNVTPRVLEEVIKKAETYEVFVEVLNCPCLTEQLFYNLFQKTKELGISKIEPDIIKHRFFNSEMFDYYVDHALHSNTVELLVNSRYATEKAYLKILNNSANQSDAIYNSIMKGRCFSSQLLKKIVSLTQDFDTLKEALESTFLTSEIFEIIVKKCLKRLYGYTDCIKLIFQSKFMTKQLLLKIVSEDKNIDLYYDKIIDSPNCDDEVISKFDLSPGNSFYSSESIIYRLLNSSRTSVNTLCRILTENYSRDNFNSVLEHPAVDSQALIRFVPIVADKSSYVLCDIIKHPQCTKEVLLEIISSHPSQSVLDSVVKHPEADDEIKLAILIHKENLSQEELDLFFSIKDLNPETIIEFLNNHRTSKIVERVIQNNYVNHGIRKSILEAISTINSQYSSRSSSSSEKSPSELVGDFLLQDLPETILVELLKKFPGTKLIKKVLKHPNASLKVVATVLVLADKISDKKASQDVIEEAIQLKKKIISQTYKIESEESVTEILRRNVEDGMSTMLWGPSGVGKSSRVFEIDPTATLLILKNGMLPEEVIGGKEPNGEPGEIYPPHWYTVLCEKCNREPNRKHILFIDEFTNVNDTIKNLVWEVVGNRLVNGHEEWPLPDNCSIVVAGNRPEESSAVRIDSTGGVMPAPLHNRIDSMLEIPFDIDEWQQWALETDNKTSHLRIHPIVYSFCVANADKVMFTQFNPEKITEPFLTPRKWETLSKAIYSVEERGKLNHISYQRIYSILGDNDIANAFIAHYERLPLDMAAIENGTYTQDDFPSFEDKLYALGIVITEYHGDEMALEDFISECLGDEYFAIYQNMRNVRNAVLSQKNGQKTM